MSRKDHPFARYNPTNDDVALEWRGRVGASVNPRSLGVRLATPETNEKLWTISTVVAFVVGAALVVAGLVI